MINKITSDIASVMASIPDGSSIMVGGFGGAGSPEKLLRALIDAEAKNLTIISNNAGAGNPALRDLIRTKRVAKVVCSFPKDTESDAFSSLHKTGEIKLELVPQGTLAERIRAAGAGIPAFFTATAVGTPLAEGKEYREINGRGFILEEALPADYALVRAKTADRHGNLIYNKTARNYAPVMCMAAKHAIVEVEECVEQLDPETIVTPGIFVKTVWHTS